MFQDLITTFIFALGFTLPSLVLSFGITYLLIMRRIQKIKLANKPLVLSIMISWFCSIIVVFLFGTKAYDGNKYLIIPLIISGIVLYVIYSKTKKESFQEKKTDSISLRR